MILAKAKLDEAQELEFSLETFGSPNQAESVRLIIEAKEFEISIPCKRNGESITAHIPKMKGILESGEHPVRMEVVLDGRIFTPLKESVEFEPLVEFDVRRTKAESVKEGVRVTVKNPAISEDTKSKSESKLEESLRTVMESGKDVSRINDKFVIKENDKYLGVISKEGEIKYASAPFYSFNEMLKTLE